MTFDTNGGGNKEMKNRKTIKEKVSPLDALYIIIQRLLTVTRGAKKVLIPVTLAAVLIAGYFLYTPQKADALTSKCTLSIISGSVDVIVPGINDFQPGTNGMTLDAGNRVKTSADSTVLLTFFDGSTLTLEPGTDVAIEQLERSDTGPTITIVLKQWAGATWSHVVKMADRRSHYEVITPSAVALVRGTRFLTEVDGAGATKVLTTEGLVSVSAQGEEIFLPVGQQTAVEPGTPPSEPITVDISEYVNSLEKVRNEANNLGKNYGAIGGLGLDNGKAGSENQALDNDQNKEGAKAHAKAPKDAAKDDPKAPKDAAKHDPKAPKDAAKHDPKAPKDAAKHDPKAPKDAAKDDPKASGKGH